MAGFRKYYLKHIKPFYPKEIVTMLPVSLADETAYVLYNRTTGLHKIGYTTGFFWDEVNKLNSLLGEPIYPILEVYFQWTRDERAEHCAKVIADFYSDRRIGNSDWYNLTRKDLTEMYRFFNSYDCEHVSKSPY